MSLDSGWRAPRNNWEDIVSYFSHQLEKLKGREETVMDFGKGNMIGTNEGRAVLSGFLRLLAQVFPRYPLVHHLVCIFPKSNHCHRFLGAHCHRLQELFPWVG